jgi:drug/metabolite transporter (DMT)-like permease
VAGDPDVKPLVVVAYLGCATIWGTTYFAIRVCIEPGGYPTYLAAALRFAIAAAILGGVVALGWARPVPRGRRALLALAAAGILNFSSYSLIYTAEEEIPGGLAAVIFGTLPLITAVLGAVTGIEKPRRGAVIGAFVSLAGLALIGLERLDVSPAQALGCLMVLGAVVCSGTYNLILKKHTQGLHPIATTATFLTITAVLMFALAAVVERQPAPWPPPVPPTVALLYLAVVGSVVAFAGYFYLLQHVGVMTLSTLVLAQPIIALFVDALFEAQKIAPRTYLGAAITLVGVLLNLLSKK